MANEKIDKFWQMYEDLPVLEQWEMFKIHVEQFSKEFSKQKVSDREIAISQLSEKIPEMEEEVSNSQDFQKHELLVKTKAELEELITEKIKGVIFHTKCRYY